MVLPLTMGAHQRLVCLTRTKFGFRQQDMEPVMFVPLLEGIG